MIWSIAWRNVWRNKVRSLVVIIAITIGMFAGVFTTAFMKGWVNQRMRDALRTELAPIQVHQEHFRDNYEIQYYIENSDEYITHLKKVEKVEGLSKRLIVNSMVASAQTGSGVRINGIDPEMERTVTNLYEHLVDGTYLDGGKRYPVLIGQKLAEKLGVGMRNKIVITVQDIHGNIVSGAFRITGIYKTINGGYDEMNLFVRYDDLLALTGLPEGSAHQIAIYTSDNQNIENTTNILASFMGEYEVESWKTLSPELSYMDILMEKMLLIIIIIILLALCFGIINTMLMVVLERVKELGMLMAIGMNRIKVFLMIMLETVFLTFTGGVVGIILGYAVSIWTSHTGINMNMWSEALEDWGYSSLIYPEISFPEIITTAVLVILTGVFSAIYPARKALKLNPSDAIRTE